MIPKQKEKFPKENLFFFQDLILVFVQEKTLYQESFIFNSVLYIVMDTENFEKNRQIKGRILFNLYLVNVKFMKTMSTYTCPDDL